MKIAVVGSGKMGSALARRLSAAGHAMTLTAARSPESLLQTAESLGVGSNPDVRAATSGAEAIVCATWPHIFAALPIHPKPGTLLMTCMSGLRPDFAGETIGLPTERRISVAEEIAARFPDAHVVESFNLTFAERIAEGHGDARPVLPYCGDSIDAKRVVAGWIECCGYQPWDAGGLKTARSMETLATTWVQFAAVTGAFPARAFSIL